MKGLLTKGQIAKLHGVSARTVARWIERGCPSVLADGERRLDPAKVERWLGEEDVPEGPAGESGDPAPSAVPKDTLRKVDYYRKITQAKRSELELAAERGLKGLGLDDLIRKARSFEEYAALDREVAALIANGTLTPDRARGIQVVLANARQNTKAHLEAHEGEENERFVLVSEEVLRIAEVFEGIESDERRAAIVAHVVAEAAADLAEHPNVDLAEFVPEEPETHTGDEEPA